MQIFQEEKSIKQPNNRAENNKSLIIPFSKHAFITFIIHDESFKSRENKKDDKTQKGSTKSFFKSKFTGMKE